MGGLVKPVSIILRSIDHTSGLGSGVGGKCVKAAIAYYIRSSTRLTGNNRYSNERTVQSDQWVACLGG